MVKKLMTKQKIHIDNLAANKKALYQARLNNIINYDLSFYRFKNGKLNISKMARCSGLSRSFLTKYLWFKGL
ncbi:hypothetical protein CCAL9344_01370 [Campylobacter sp. RM9344]|uniref:Uncharacterized protein n=1 Tax=Campylobacter californiensis TaxID=1032243 RepID=A0AAW3ZQE3_9BACT|nr:MULTISPECIES: hypothetical protein [unclassified Campylobacter]MBE2984666.1 hypothetical protein [Campylobacter sp. RM6883]MBE2994582.1 hypothetical protein [Campylobacter sp. RM6913]MBE3028849.1 hypothetical protein [Campylobacter sp. RM9344]MBE3607207.1 hypothetical protein [Campylobacter sp. RM9337]MBE3609493.1 hypothetical protein [Campylobacter sp. RM12916]